jgi:hypothetical protein
MPSHGTVGTDLLCATVSAGRRLEVTPDGARRAGSGLVTGRDLEKVSSGLAGSVLPSLFARLPPGLPAGHRFARSLPGYAQLLPNTARSLPGYAQLLPSIARSLPSTARLLPGLTPDRYRPDDHRTAACCPRTDRTTRRAVPSPVLHAGSITVPAPLLRNRFLSLVRFPSRHAAVRSADEPVSPGFGPLAGLTPERHEARTSGSQVLPGLPGSSG